MPKDNRGGKRAGGTAAQKKSVLEVKEDFKNEGFNRVEQKSEYGFVTLAGFNETSGKFRIEQINKEGRKINVTASRSKEFKQQILETKRKARSSGTIETKLKRKF